MRRLAVGIKQVPAAGEGATDPEGGLMIRTGRRRMNPYDASALEAALRLRDQFGGVVDVFSMGPPAAREVLAEALTLGADAAWLLQDQAFAGGDTLATARTLVQGFQSQGGYDLYVFGQRTTDGDTGQVGPAVAALLGRPFIGRVVGLTEAGADGLTLAQVTDGRRQEVRCGWPLVISVVKGEFPPRLPSLKMKLRKKTVSELGLNDLPLPEAARYGLAGSPTRVKRAYRPERPPRAGKNAPEPMSGPAAAAALWKAMT